MILRSSILAQGILWPSCGHQYWHRVSKSGLIGYWRATPFITGLLPRAFQPTMFMTGPRLGTSDGAILRQGMHMNIFSNVYCDRVYFLCTERIATGSGFRPPAAPPPPIHMKVEWPPPPPPRGRPILAASSAPTRPLIYFSQTVLLWRVY